VKFVIAADGVHSATAKARRLARSPALAPALEHEIYLADEDSRAPARCRDSISTPLTPAMRGFSPSEPISPWEFSARIAFAPICKTKLADYLRELGITRIQKVERHGLPHSAGRHAVDRSRGAACCSSAMPPGWWTP